MGTEISLSLGGADLAWSKNHRGMDHGALFQEHDRKPLHDDQTDYQYYGAKGIDHTAMEMAFVRRLDAMVPRLELLGFTLEHARRAYEIRAQQWRVEQEGIWIATDSEPKMPLSFEEFTALTNRVPIASLADSYIHSDTKDTDGAVKGRFSAEAEVFTRIPGVYDYNDVDYSELSYFSRSINILHPYLMLRILAENPTNRTTDVVWKYGPLVEGGWAEAGEFQGDARRTDTFLIATEGSSDAHILRHALQLLRPNVLDFFRFIDVSKGHPFSGTGNLVKFAEGLAKIDIHNQTVFVFDNDAEGVEAFNRVRSLTLPVNMRAIVLPDLECFRAFPTRGPEGQHFADINGRAAAIECYLDHRLLDYPPPRVIWTNYKREIDAYHGALEHKESYSKEFLRLRPENFAQTGYDFERLGVVLDALISECTSIAHDGVAGRFGLAQIMEE
jgi:hypothetical protein